MNFLDLFKQSQIAFSVESELELCYLFGKKLKEIEYMKLKKPRFRGLVLQSLGFFYLILRGFSFFPIKQSNQEIYVFAGTDNQFNSLKSTLLALKERCCSMNLTFGHGVSEGSRQFIAGQVVKLNPKVTLVAIILFFYRAIPLYLQLKKDKRILEISFHFSKFCQSYFFVPFFLNNLYKTNPSLVIVSNDHNVNNRSLRLAAEILSIKTLYMQHASVSEIFPPLEFDYALLDGKVAHDIYDSCYKLQNCFNSRIEKNVSKCQVVFSGQKKLVVHDKKLNENEVVQIGLAVNQIDDFHCVKVLLDTLNILNQKCIIRTHPFQNNLFLTQLHDYLKNNILFSWSDSRVQTLAEYFQLLNVVIAGNTSIHLEAALAGLPTIYYEMSDVVHRPDYYAYVKNGVSISAENEITPALLNSAFESVHSKERHLAIKNYSETYGTAWQNREGVLSALFIDSIVSGKQLCTLFKNEDSSVYKSVKSLI